MPFKIIDEKQKIYSLGFRYDYDKKAWFSLQGNMVDYEDANNTSTPFDLNQLFIAFGLKF